MKYVGLNWAGRARGGRRGALILSLTVALMGWGASAGAQGLPSADSLGEDEPLDEELEPLALPDEEDGAEGADSEELGDEEDTLEVEESSGELPETAPVEAGDTRLAQGLNYEGGYGFHGVASAIPGKKRTHHIGLQGVFSKGSDVIREGDENEFLNANLLLRLNIFKDLLSLNVGLNTSNNVNTYAQPRAMLSQGSLHAGLTSAAWEATPGLFLSTDVTGFLPVSFTSSGYNAGAASMRLRMLLSADFGELMAPTADGDRIGLRGHFNFAYFLDRSSNLMSEGLRPTRIERFAHQLSGYDYLEMGLGLEYAFSYVAPYAAWNLRIPVNADDGVCGSGTPLGCVSEEGFKAFPDVLSLGLRGEPAENLALQAGVDIGLTSEHVEGVPATLPWQVLVGATWRIDLEPKVEYIEKVVEEEKVVQAESESAFILGNVVDKASGQPIEGAIISYRDPAEKTAQATSARGSFISYGVAPGKEVKLTVRHPDYKSADISQMIDGPGEVELDIELEAETKTGKISGTVIDQDGEPVSGATVKLAGAEQVEESTGADGRFSSEVLSGAYSVAVSAEGYLTGGRDVTISADRAVLLEITLKPSPEEELVEVTAERINIKQKVFFDTGKATIQERSFDVLDQVASVMIDNASIQKVLVEGHTDDVGDADDNMALSKERADSVADYLVEQGVSRARLEAEGFGQTQPLVPNSSPRQRSLNRRVEFKITDQAD